MIAPIFGIGREILETTAILPSHVAFMAMKKWMLPLLFPLALIGGVVLVVVFNHDEALAAVVAGVVIVPVLVRVYLPARGEHDDTNYWRMRRP